MQIYKDYCKCASVSRILRRVFFSLDGFLRFNQRSMQPENGAKMQCQVAAIRCERALSDRGEDGLKAKGGKVEFSKTAFLPCQSGLFASRKRHFCQAKCMVLRAAENAIA